jgi:hypothetical protein
MKDEPPTPKKNISRRSKMKRVLLTSVIGVLALLQAQNCTGKTEEKEAIHNIAQTGSKSLAINNLQEAINYSGKTRMLSQRIANQYGFQVSEKMDAERKQDAKEKLTQAQKLMNDIYSALLAFAPIASQAELKEVVETGQEAWRQMEKKLARQPTKAGFVDILSLSDTLLSRNEAMTQKLTKQSSGSKGGLVNIAGRQRMYSMKLARDYLAASMNIDKANRMELMLETANNFESAIQVMKSASDNTNEIKGMLKSISMMEWRKVYQSVNECVKNKGTTFNVVMMFLYCERLLQKADRLTSLYTTS